jgi:hypothetical protein
MLGRREEAVGHAVARRRPLAALGLALELAREGGR